MGVIATVASALPCSQGELRPLIAMRFSNCGSTP